MPIFTITQSLTYKGQAQPVSTLVTVPTEAMKNLIEKDMELQKYIIDLTLGPKDTHTFGATCSGTTAGATHYVHKSEMQLIGFKGGKKDIVPSTNKTPGSIEICCFGRAKGGKHKFATDQSLYNN